MFFYLQFNFVFSDGLLSQEQDDIVQRVTCLENKVQQQEDEIICLKSAMADIVRRFSFTNSSTSLDMKVVFVCINIQYFCSVL